MIIKVLNLMGDRKPVEVDEEGSDGGPFGLVENEACCYTLNPRMELAGTPGSSAFLSSFEITRAWTSSRVVVVCVFFFPQMPSIRKPIHVWSLLYFALEY